MSFESFNLHPSIMDGIRSLGYTTPTPIQSQAIPPILIGRDVMGLAQTGTGKTAAFALPVLQRLLSSPRGDIRALVISPTRELAEQTSDSISKLATYTRLRSTAIYGGVGMEQQLRQLRGGVEFVVGCPGRLLDHLWRGNLSLAKLEVLVIDEADRMFDMGFLPEVHKILACILQPRQTLLFSATMPANIRTLAKEILRDPLTVQVDPVAPAVTVSHAVFPVKQHLKTALLRELLKRTITDSVLVFTRTKHRAERLAQQLGRDGPRVAVLQGNMSQSQRQSAMEGFRDGSYKIMVATDIAARGIDVLEISHVINYDMPDDTDAYIHRIGRTGRVGRSGEALTFITGEDNLMVRRLEQVLKKPLERRTLPGFDYNLPNLEAVQPRSTTYGRNRPIRNNQSSQRSQPRNAAGSPIRSPAVGSFAACGRLATSSG